MKKSSKKPNGVAIVRKATGLSQQKFGTALGVSKATIENIELGRAPVSEALAEAIGALTGAVPWTISSDGGPRDFNNKCYSAESWKHWQEYEFDNEKINRLAEMARERLSVLVEAAARNTAGELGVVPDSRKISRSHVFRSVMMEFNRFVFAQIKKYHLEPRITALMQEQFSKTKQGTTTVAEAGSYFRDSPAWKANKAPFWKPSTTVRYTSQSIPQFVPSVGFWKFDDGIPAFLNGLRVERQIFNLNVEGRKFRIIKDKMNADLMTSRHFTLSEKPQFFERRKRKV